MSVKKFMMISLSALATATVGKEARREGIIANAEPGAIYLLHDFDGNEATVEALDEDSTAQVTKKAQNGFLSPAGNRGLAFQLFDLGEQVVRGVQDVPAVLEAQDQAGDQADGRATEESVQFRSAELEILDHIPDEDT